MATETGKDFLLVTTYSEFIASKALVAAPVFIYGLYDPETCELRYIGKSTRPHQRLTNHCNEKSRCHRTNWIQSLLRRGLRPNLEIIEEIRGNWPWQESERFWIAHCRARGCRLTNSTNGGDGVEGNSGEGKERMARTWRGRKHRPETIEKLKAIRALRITSPETRAKMSRSQSGRKITWAAKIAAVNRKLTPEAVEQIKGRIEAGELVKNLAAEFGVHRTTLSKITTGAYFGRETQ